MIQFKLNMLTATDMEMFYCLWSEMSLQFWMTEFVQWPISWKILEIRVKYLSISNKTMFIANLWEKLTLICQNKVNQKKTFRWMCFKRRGCLCVYFHFCRSDLNRQLIRGCFEVTVEQIRYEYKYASLRSHVSWIWKIPFFLLKLSGNNIIVVDDNEYPQW